MGKRILFLVSSMASGGAERVAANLANAWANDGSEVILLATFSGRGECFYPLTEKVDFRYLTDETTLKLPRAFSTIFRLLKLRRLVRSTQPDFVISFLTNVNVAALLATLGLRTPVIVCERTFPPLFPVGVLLNFLRRLTYPFASCVVMQSKEGVRWLDNEIPRSRGVVVSNPILFPLPLNNPNLPPHSVTDPNRKILLAIGRMSEEKGFDELIQAFSVLAKHHPLWDLIILGDGPLRTAIADQTNSLGLAKRVLMPGRVGNVGEWYHRANLYVMSSRVEGFPNTLAEAMAHGCAVVSFDCDTGPRDLIRHEVDGLLVPPRDVAALANALGRLMGDENLRIHMSARAVEIRDRYSMARVLARWDQLFAEVVH
jgi:glycosyltransferase involved in cell wall biosynthesis